MIYEFRSAKSIEAQQIWVILQHAIERRRNDGSDQWQNGYPNPQVVEKDIEKGNAFVLTHEDEIIAYCAVLINDEPAYADIIGKWLSDGDFIVVHRVAVSQKYLGKGFVQRLFECIEGYAIAKNISSIKVDTKSDNGAMLNILKKLGYIYCGEVFFNGSARRAYEKIVSL